MHHRDDCFHSPWASLFWMSGKGFGCGHGRGHGPGHPPPPGQPPDPPYPPPPWFAQMFGSPPPRAERGEVRYLILDALAEQPRHGYEIIQTIEARSNSAYRPSPGTVYPTLQMLEELGLVRSSERGGKKVYEITDEGKAELEAHASDVEDAYARFCRGSDWADFPQLHELFDNVQHTLRSLGSTFRRGRLGSNKLREIQGVLRDASERIEKILRG